MATFPPVHFLRSGGESPASNVRWGVQGEPRACRGRGSLEGASVKIWESWEFLGIRTNNEAEYGGLLLGLREMVRSYLGLGLVIECDSLIVVKQFTGAFSCRAPHLDPYRRAAWRLLDNIKNLRIPSCGQDL